MKCKKVLIKFVDGSMASHQGTVIEAKVEYATDQPAWLRVDEKLYQTETLYNWRHIKKVEFHK